jgi:hypothetical protein
VKHGIAGACIALLIATACGDGTAEDGGGGSNTADIDVCSLLSDEEVSSAVGVVPASEPTEPAGPFTGCKWGNGFLYVQIAPSTTLITAPGEDECSAAGVGEESVACPGSVKFLTNGFHTTISTIEDVTTEQMINVATILLPKLDGF